MSNNLFLCIIVITFLDYYWSLLLISACFMSVAHCWWLEKCKYVTPNRNLLYHICDLHTRRLACTSWLSNQGLHYLRRPCGCTSWSGCTLFTSIIRPVSVWSASNDYGVSLDSDTCTVYVQYGGMIALLTVQYYKSCPNFGWATLSCCRGILAKHLGVQQ